MSRASLPRPFSCPDRALKRCRPPGLPDRKTATSCACALFAHPGRGHRPCHSVPPGSGPAGGLSPRPSPAPSPTGASRPPGRVLACRWCGRHRFLWKRRARAGETRVAFPPPALTKALSPLQWQGPSPLPQRQAEPRRAGGQSPRPAPAPPPAGASPPPGRALASGVPGPAGPQGAVARGRGKRGSRFLFPPGLTKALSPLPWQGPSPLPQRHADPWPAWGQRPRPVPALPPAGVGLC